MLTKDLGGGSPDMVSLFNLAVRSCAAPKYQDKSPVNVLGQQEHSCYENASIEKTIILISPLFLCVKCSTIVDS